MLARLSPLLWFFYYPLFLQFIPLQFIFHQKCGRTIQSMFVLKTYGIYGLKTKAKLEVNLKLIKEALLKKGLFF
ncbi:hypothetical protein CV739_22400 [Bacillus velezensis]|nr:hypothetical protein CV739_22400 [Bacillus velezensis]